ncbi:DUF4321 domain-containing protein [candidate division KSB1 bacterium]|nr:DUF4321 domain-containing protein [candidate division KSB1 bacterium]
MLKSKRTVGIFVVTFIAGAILGTFVGELIAFALPDGVVKDFFLLSVNPAIGPTTLDIGVLTLTLGLTLHINVIGFLGIAIAFYVLRWY